MSRVRAQTKRSLKAVRDVLLRAFARAFSPAFGFVARSGVGAEHCLDHGFLPVPKHFYQPIFEPRDLPSDHWVRKDDLEGVDFDVDGQLELLAKLGRYGTECSWPVDADRPVTRYHSNNGSFGYSSACFLHAFLRHTQPARVVEVGCGMSTLLMREALLRGVEQNGGSATVTTVDPFPPEFIEVLPQDSVPVELLKIPVEAANPSIFEQLEAGDLLFIDSSHVVRAGGDVLKLYLEVLPRVQPGVYIHVHDIQFPYDYPEEYVTRRKAPRLFWTEQYLLQAFLAFNDSFKVLLAGYQLQRDYVQEVAAAFPLWEPGIHRPTSSFYMQRVS